MSFSSLFGARLGPCSGVSNPARRLSPPSSSSTIARATSVYAFAGNGAGDHGTGKTATYERVLRYPDGGERRIRYPVIPAEDPPVTESCGEEWETLNSWKNNSRVVGKTNTRTDLRSSRQTSSTGSAPSVESFVPPSPLALLRLLTSPDNLARVRQEEQAVRQSYVVLSGCPWPSSKPLYVLATRTGQTHTLRTRLSMDQVQNEINQLLSRNRKNKYKVDDDQPIIKCSQMVDGVVAFEDEGDAERYGFQLEEGQLTVNIARCDAFDLFKSVNETKGVVILLRRGAEIPLPHRLAASVRSDNHEDNIL